VNTIRYDPCVDRAEDLHLVDVALARISRASYSKTLRQQTQERADVAVPPNAIAALSAVVRLGPMRLGAIAERLEVQQSRASKEVQRLVAAGFVEQLDDPEDRRASLVRATPAGQDAYKRYRAAADELLAERLDDWSDREVHALARQLTKLAKSFGVPT